MQGAGLQLMHSFETGLYSTGRFTILPASGVMVIDGNTTETDPRALHVYALTDAGLDRRRSVHLPCSHGGDSITGLVIDGQELVAVACSLCVNIKLVDIQTGSSSVAYNLQTGSGAAGHKLYKYKTLICRGEPQRLWVCRFYEVLSQKTSIVELNCSEKRFSETGRVVKTNKWSENICYIEDRLIIDQKEKIKAISCDSGATQWKISEADGKEFISGHILLTSQQRILLVADVDNRRLLLLKSNNGAFVQSTRFPDTMGNPTDICWHNDQLVVKASYPGKKADKIFFFFAPNSL